MTTSRLSLLVLVLTIISVGLLQSFESHATSCTSTTKKQVKDRSQRYKDLVRLEINTYNNVRYFVGAYFPPEIMGQNLRDVWLFKGAPTYGADKPDYDFSMSLGVTEQKDGRMYSRYSLITEYSKDNYIGASYGEGCDFEIQYHVDFDESIRR